MSSGTRWEDQLSFFGLPSPGERGGDGAAPSEAPAGPIHLEQFGFPPHDPEVTPESQAADQRQDQGLHSQSSSQRLYCSFPGQTRSLVHIKGTYGDSDE